MTRQRAGLAVAALLGTLALGACSATPTPAASSPSPTVSASPTATASAEPSATPLPTPSTEAPAGPLALPACEALLPLAVAQEQLGGNTIALDPWATAAEVMPGPAAVEAASSAVQSELCAWGIPNSDGGFHVVTAELTAASADGLKAALRSAGTFAEIPVEGGTAFSRDLDSEIGAFAVAYVFYGPAWVTAVGSLTSEGARSIALTALDAVRTANPSSLG